MAHLVEARSRDDLEILSGPRPLQFGVTGNLSDEHMKTPAGTPEHVCAANV